MPVREEYTISKQNESRHYHHYPNDIVNIEPEASTFKKKRRTVINEKHFLLCESCFWCASSFNIIGYTISTTAITKCHSCNNNKVESIPISYNEVYKFDYDPKENGVALQFSKRELEDEKILINRNVSDTKFHMMILANGANH
jgi:hypothetical protein